MLGVDRHMWKTRQMNRLLVALATLALALLVSGCAARPQLLPHDASNPAGTDLSGRWELRSTSGEPLAAAVPREEGIRLSAMKSERSRSAVSRTSGSKRTKGPAVHVFIENGKLLEVTQTEYGLFVAYDRAIVEEFTFGENRVVSLGPIEAQRVSGWQGPDFIVETMDQQGVTLRETWGLVEGGNVLNREIVMLDGEDELFAALQVFDRAE